MNINHFSNTFNLICTCWLAPRIGAIYQSTDVIIEELSDGKGSVVCAEVWFGRSSTRLRAFSAYYTVQAINQLEFLFHKINIK